MRSQRPTNRQPRRTRANKKSARPVTGAAAADGGGGAARPIVASSRARPTRTAKSRRAMAKSRTNINLPSQLSPRVNHAGLLKRKNRARRTPLMRRLATQERRPLTTVVVRRARGPTPNALPMQASPTRQARRSRRQAMAASRAVKHGRHLRTRPDRSPGMTVPVAPRTPSQHPHASRNQRTQLQRSPRGACCRGMHRRSRSRRSRPTARRGSRQRTRTSA